MLRRLLLILFALLGLLRPAIASDIKVLAPNAAKDSVVEAISVFERATGHKVIVTWSGTEAITKRIAEGESFDVVVNAAQNIDRQTREGKLAQGTRTDFARSSIGAAVQASSAKVDISTVDALKAALLSAGVIVVSSGTSGRHMLEVFSNLGIREQLEGRIKQPSSGAQIADLLASGEADLGFQQVSELLNAKGVHYLGPIPTELQSYTAYSAAIHANALHVDEAKVLLQALRSPSVKSILRNSGMDPI